jgi:hypothetical protein
MHEKKPEGLRRQSAEEGILINRKKKEAFKLRIKEIHDYCSLSNSSVIKSDKEYKSSLIISIKTTYNFRSFNHAE